MEDKYQDYRLNKQPRASLYTWIRCNITDVARDNNVSNFSFTYYREDGYNFSYELTNKHINDSAYKRLVTTKVERVVDSVKSSKQKERSLLFTKLTTVDPSTDMIKEEEHLYLIVKLEDVNYTHEKLGKQTKHMISVTELNTQYTRDYLNHFKVSGFINEIIKDDYLISLITLNSIDPSKLVNITSNAQFDVIEKINETLSKLDKLYVFFLALSNEELSCLAELPFKGQPNYAISSDNRVKVFLQDTTHLSNSSANWFFLDTICPKITEEQ